MTAREPTEPGFQHRGGGSFPVAALKASAEIRGDAEPEAETEQPEIIRASVNYHGQAAMIAELRIKENQLEDSLRKVRAEIENGLTNLEERGIELDQLRNRLHTDLKEPLSSAPPAFAKAIPVDRGDGGDE